MRGLMRNKRPIFYCNFASTEYEEVNGRKTGRRSVVYSNVKTAYGTVSAPQGSASLDMFGTDEDYDKTLVFDTTNLEITENTVFWLDKPYAEGVAHDYIVRKVARHMNFMFVGCRKVNVVNAQTNTSTT